MSNILSLDMGTTQLKKVFFNISGKHFNITKKTKPNKVIATLPSNFLTFRSLNVPFSERRKINEIIKTELAQSLLFFEDAIWKFSHIQDKNVFVTIARKSDIEKFLKMLPEKPNILEAEPYALARLALITENPNSLIIDWGASKTVFCGIKNKHLNFCRVILKGGNNLTQEITNKNIIHLEKAEISKRERGTNLPQVTNFLEEILDLACLPSQFTYDNILLTGGGANLPGLEKFLADRFKVKVSKLSLPDNLPNSQAVAIGAGLKDVAGEHGVNLLPQTLADSRPYKKWLIAASLILLIFSLDVKLKEVLLNKEYKALTNNMKKIVKRECPELKKIVSPLSQLKGIVIKEKKYSLGAALGPLNIFSKISKDTENQGLTVYEINLSPEEINLQGSANSVKSVEESVKNLTRNLGETELVEAKSISGGKIKFILRTKLGKE